VKPAWVLAVALAVCWSAPAAAYDPDAVRSPDPAPPADSSPVEVPSDVYRVTEAYRGDAVLRSGDVLSYLTLTRPVEADAYARVLGVAASGEASPWDSLAFNGRATLTDGRAIAGTFYENYFRDGDRLVPWSIVFFQDDRELLAGAATRPAPAVRSPARGTGSGEAHTMHSLRIGVDPSGGDRLLQSLEVARGQRFALRVNAQVDGQDAVLESWALISGTNDVSTPAGPRAADELLNVRWDRLPAPHAPWTLTLWARARVPGSNEGVIEGTGQIAIWIRAPALVE
jgi:hypothetical protein